MTDMAIACLSLIGSILIFCVGVNLVWGKTIRVANMLPAVILAVIAAYLTQSEKSKPAKLSERLPLNNYNVYI